MFGPRLCLAHGWVDLEAPWHVVWTRDGSWVHPFIVTFSSHQQQRDKSSAVSYALYTFANSDQGLVKLPLVATCFVHRTLPHPATSWNDVANHDEELQAFRFVRSSHRERPKTTTRTAAAPWNSVRQFEVAGVNLRDRPC
jgi:hypothetical protein